MKKLILIFLIGVFLQLTSCILPVIAGFYAAGEANNKVDKGLMGDFHGEQEKLTYHMIIEPTQYSYNGKIIILQEKDTINQCTFSSVSSKQGSGIGESAMLFCEKDSVQGVFSMQLDRKATELTVFGVSPRLDLAIPNNLVLIKKIPEK